MRMGDGKQKLNRDQILEFIQREGKVRYDEIMREDLPVEGHFDSKAYEHYLKLAGISEVLDRDGIVERQRKEDGRKMERIVKGLRESGLIMREGAPHGGRWVVLKRQTEVEGK